MASEVVKLEPRAVVAQASGEGQHFELMQRKAALFAASPLIPESLRAGGQQQALANCYIGLQMAEAMQENALTVLQNIHVVKGKAGFSAQFMIARANASGIFKDGIDWRIEGVGEALAVTAFATLAATGREVAFTASMAMAKAEGWTSNPKYRSMPELMLRYRSGTFLVRLYAPQVMFGYQTAEEIDDTRYAAMAGQETVDAKPTGRALLEASLADDEEPEANEPYEIPAPVEEATATTATVDAGESAAPASEGFDLGEPDHMADATALDTRYRAARDMDELQQLWTATVGERRAIITADANYKGVFATILEREKARFEGVTA